MLDLPFTCSTALLVLTPQQLVPCLKEHQLACETQCVSVRLKRKHIFHMRAQTSCEASKVVHGYLIFKIFHIYCGFI